MQQQQSGDLAMPQLNKELLSYQHMLKHLLLQLLFQLDVVQALLSHYYLKPHLYLHWSFYLLRVSIPNNVQEEFMDIGPI